MDLPTNDAGLLERFVRYGSPEAFRELVARHTDLVYSCARQRLRDAHAAEDVTQSVFLALALKAKSLRRDVSLPGWLCRATRYACAIYQRGEQRRKEREMHASEQWSVPAAAPVVWAELEPHLADVLDALSDKNREAILARFYQRGSYRDVAAVLHTTEEGARKRVDRALEKLRRRFARKGVGLPVAGLAGLLAANAVQAAPPGLAGAASATALNGLGGSLAATPTLLLAKGAIHMLFMTKMKLAALVTATVMLLIGGVAGGGLRLAFAGPGPASPRAASYPVDKASTQQVSITASSFLGGDGDSVRGARIQSDGSIVLAANLAAAQIAGTEIALLGVDAKARGCVLRLSPDGQKVLAAVRIADAVSDLAIDAKDAIYVAAGVRGAIKLSPGADKVLWTRDIGGPCVRIDAGADGHCVAVAAGKGVTLFDPDGKELGRGLGRTNTADACLDAASRTIVTVGFRQARAYYDRRAWPVQISYALGFGYDGKQKWCNYDWSTDRDSDRFINKSGNNMADTRGYRCAIGRDGKLYCAFESAGGNHIFHYSPTNIMATVKLVGGDQYHQFHASAAEHKSVLLKFDPATGRFLQGQQFCPRKENGRAGNSRVKDGDIAADADGRVLLAGYADPNLPLSLDPCPPEQPKGGAYLLALSPDMARRLVCTRVAGSAQQGISSACCVDARKVGDRWVVIYGGFGAKAGMHTAAPLQKQATGPAGFFAVLEAQSAVLGGDSSGR